ncbi:MAG: hypothetical protein IIZ78_25550 [Clostridiales bacterium]|nr:hypothetical protein [Clostridiales bacterium]
MFEGILRKYMQPIIKDAQEEAYKQGAEDVIRRFAFVYDEVRNIAREDARAEAGEIAIEEIDEEYSQTIFEEIANV